MFKNEVSGMFPRIVVAAIFDLCMSIVVKMGLFSIKLRLKCGNNILYIFWQEIKKFFKVKNIFYKMAVPAILDLCIHYISK